MSLPSDSLPPRADEHFHLGAPQVVDRDDAGFEYTCRPFAQGAPEVRAVRCTAEPLSLAPAGAQPERTTTPSARRVVFPVHRTPPPSPPPSARDLERSVRSGTFASSLCGTDGCRTWFTLWHLPGATSEPFDTFLGVRYRRHSFVAGIHCGGLPLRVGRKVSRNVVGIDFAYHRRRPLRSSIKPRSIASSIVRLISRRGIRHHCIS